MTPLSTQWICHLPFLLDVGAYPITTSAARDEPHRESYPRFSILPIFLISVSRGSLRATNERSSLAALLRNHSSHFPTTTRGTLPPCSMLKPETISSASAGSISHVHRVKPPLSFSTFVGIQPDSPRLFRYSAVKRDKPKVK